MTSDSDSPFDTNTQGLATFSDEMRKLFADVKGHALVTETVPVPLAEICPVAASNAEVEQKRAKVRATQTFEELKGKIGTKTPDGIIIGPVTICGQDFMASAAPQLLADASGRTDIKYNDAKKLVAEMPDWLGHNVIDYGTEKEFLAAVENGNYTDGSWFIPTLELVRGTNAKGIQTQKFNLSALKLSGTFLTATSPETGVVSTVTLPSKLIDRATVNMAQGQCLLMRLDKMS